MKQDQIHKYRFNSELISEFSVVLDKYIGKISVAEAIGSLEILKHDLLVSTFEEYYED